jgi:hypothetical protein
LEQVSNIFRFLRGHVPDALYSTFGKSGHIKSQRSCTWGASRFGQSALSISRHFIILPLRPYFSISRATP